MSANYNGQGTVPFATTGTARLPIIGTAGATGAAIRVTTGFTHGFNTGDTVEQEGCVDNAANGLFIISVVDAHNYTLNGTTASGGSGTTGGYAIDYEVQPAYALPQPGNAASMVTMGPVLEGLANTTPWLYRRTGKWRLFNEYTLLEGYAGASGWVANPWAQTNVSAIGSTMAATIPGTTFSFASMASPQNYDPIWQGSDYLQFSVSLNLLAQGSHSGAGSFTFAVGFIGIALTQGASLAKFGMPAAMYQVAGATTTYQPITLSGGIYVADTVLTYGFTFPNTMGIALIAWMDSDLDPSTDTINNYLVGPYVGWFNQYRPNT